MCYPYFSLYFPLCLKELIALPQTHTHTETRLLYLQDTSRWTVCRFGDRGLVAPCHLALFQVVGNKLVLSLLPLRSFSMRCQIGAHFGRLMEFRTSCDPSGCQLFLSHTFWTDTQWSAHLIRFTLFLCWFDSFRLISLKRSQQSICHCRRYNKDALHSEMSTHFRLIIDSLATSVGCDKLLSAEKPPEKSRQKTGRQRWRH